jgi:hypothetical protein
MTDEELISLIDAIAPVIREYVVSKASALETRIKSLESRPLLKYAGVFREGATYAEGHLATHAGGLWLATESTTFTPGTAGSGWRLIVKRGDAR